MYVCIYVHMYVCTYVRMYACMYVCVKDATMYLEFFDVMEKYF